MTPQASRVAQVCRLLNDEDARYLVVGAIAMQLWGTTRATRDIDILIEPTIENATRVLRYARVTRPGSPPVWRGGRTHAG